MNQRDRGLSLSVVFFFLFTNLPLIDSARDAALVSGSATKPHFSFDRQRSSRGSSSKFSAETCIRFLLLTLAAVFMCQTKQPRSSHFRVAIFAPSGGQNGLFCTQYPCVSPNSRRAWSIRRSHSTLLSTSDSKSICTKPLPFTRTWRHPCVKWGRNSGQREDPLAAPCAHAGYADTSLLQHGGRHRFPIRRFSAPPASPETCNVMYVAVFSPNGAGSVSRACSSSTLSCLFARLIAAFTSGPIGHRRPIPSLARRNSTMLDRLVVAHPFLECGRTSSCRVI